MTYFDYIKKKLPQTVRYIGELVLVLSLGSLLFHSESHNFSFSVISPLMLISYLSISVFGGAWLMRKNDEWLKEE